MRCRLLSKNLNKRNKHRSLSRQDRAKLIDTIAISMMASNVAKATAGIAKATKAMAQAARDSMEVTTDGKTEV